MRINEAQLKSIIDELTLDKEQLKEVASALRFDMELALQGRESSMPMLCSYIGMPTGQEKGEFLALDFGGTNLRAELVSLKGDCQYEIVKMVAKPLVTEEYNLINALHLPKRFLTLLPICLLSCWREQKTRPIILVILSLSHLSRLIFTMPASWYGPRNLLFLA